MFWSLRSENEELAFKEETKRGYTRCGKKKYGEGERC